MSSIEITDEQHDRIIALRDELEAIHAGHYTSVTLPDVVAYLLDLADAVDDTDRQAEITAGDDTADPSRSFPREELEAELKNRNRQHGESDESTPMDLYSIAAEYEISGRSNMAKQELITAILDTVEHRYTDPLAPVDIDFPDTISDNPEPDDADVKSDAADDAELADTESDAADDAEPADTESDAADESGAGQLNAMLDLLNTHSDKWRPGDGDARYEVELPDGNVEPARTKDDVRAILFKHY